MGQRVTRGEIRLAAAGDKTQPVVVLNRRVRAVSDATMAEVCDAVQYAIRC